MTQYSGLALRLNQNATTKRRNKVGTKFTDEENLTSLQCSYPYPLSGEVKLRMGLDTPHEILEVFTMAIDIETGDIFVFDGVEYPIKAVEKWPRINGRFLRLILEELSQ